MLVAAVLSLSSALLAAPAATPPVTFVHRAPASGIAGAPLLIEGHILGASEVETALLYYRKAGADRFRHRELELVQGDHYRAVIPGPEVTAPAVEYYVVAVDFLQTQISAFASELHPASVPVTERAAETGADSDAAGPTPTPTPMPTPTPAVAPLEPGALVRDATAIASMGARTLADVLATFPGLEVTRDLSGFAHVAIRGVGGDGDVALLVDDQPVNDAYDGRALWDLPAGILHRVEVQIGPRRELAAADAVAGSVRVATGGAESQRMAIAAGTHASDRTSAAAHRRGSYAASAHGGLRFAPLVLSGFAAVNADDGTEATISRDAFSTASGRSQTPGPARDGGLSLFAGAGVSLSRLIPGTLDLLGRFAWEHRGAYVGRVDTYGPGGTIDAKLGLLQVRHALSFGDGRTLTTAVGLDAHQAERNYQLTPAGFAWGDRNGDGVPETFETGILETESHTTLAAFATVRTDLKLAAGHTLKAGVFATRRQTGSLAVRRNVDSAGAARGLGQIELGAPIAPLARNLAALQIADDWAVNSKTEVAVGLGAAYVSDLERFEASKLLSPHVGVSYRPSDAWRLKALYGSSVRPPTFAERTDKSATSLPSALAADRFVGNPHLNASARHQVEAGVEARTTAADVALEAAVSGWYARLAAAIASVAGSAATDPASQLARVDNRPPCDSFGADVEIRLALGGRSRVSLGGAWQRLREQSGAGRGTLLTTEPQLVGVLGLHVELPMVGGLDLIGRYGGERRNNARTVVERLRVYRLPAYTDITLAVRSPPLKDALRLGVAIHNLFDHDRRDPVPRPDLMPELLPREGFQILATVEVGAP
ncbi:MAG: TonB-dependent receptor [Deltaproteobacteria bacterium]|nr:TonB-dependent receptor [Deltaproteobacteria bacterium]